MEINNLIESKIFISLISLFFGIFIYWFYLYIKELQKKYEFSDELREVVNHYIKNGAITVREYGALIRIVAQMGNYLGIYREHVQRMIKEFDENGGLNFAEGVFDETENNADNKEKNNDTERLLKENLRLKQQLNNIKTPLIIENNENDF
ncbi:MAG: hypothetical protein U9532_03615 ['Conium maculatum' witches'-broom phytoplasma]|nr:hypothetical protein ['Conium maculatum' witches'-broom phytoplasma]MEC4558813.1 hypothetical protein ['Conium maculatum' witches'-broom phytoplasma]MEC4559222.1 hypothetical protein ['Conium maculatum' witches'-broom phytoplasma]